MMKRNLIERPEQLKRLLLFRDTDLIKVVTGLRRSGKSCLLELAYQHLLRENDSNRSFLTLNLEDRECNITNADDLYKRCKASMFPDKTTYLFIDEIQRIENWHDVINSLRVRYNCDIYLTGSNAFLLSSELSTYLSGRYVEINLLPLSFTEYIRFCGLKPNSTGSILTNVKTNEPLMVDELLERYLTFGGLPALANLTTTQDQHAMYLKSLIDTVVVRDIMSKERNASERKLSSEDALRAICTFLADNIGNILSARKIAQTINISDKTVNSYIKALNDAYIFYETKRYDIHGKALLRNLPKQYITDLGIRSNLLGYKSSDAGSCLENAVYLHLKNNGWSVHIGTLHNKEVDFVCIHSGKITYVQVTHDMSNETTKQRELAPLRAISDNYEKIVVVRNATYETDIDGIKIIPAYKFLLGMH